MALSRLNLLRRKRDIARAQDQAVVDSRRFTDDYGTTIYNIHLPEVCAGRPCSIHAPSAEARAIGKLSIRVPGPWDIKPMHFERICEHGVGHPDPDDLAYWCSLGEDSMGVHGCDGCCRPGGFERLQRESQEHNQALADGRCPGPSGCCQ